MITLSEIKGIGKKVEENLVDYFGSEEEAIDAILNGRISEIGNIPGIGLGKAFQIVKNAYEQVEGVTSTQVLKTEDIQKIYNHIMGIIRSYSKTAYAKEKLMLYWPLPPSKIDKIKNNLARFTESRKIIESLGKEKINEILNLLNTLTPLKKGMIKKKIEGRAIITKNDNAYQDIRNQKIDKYCVAILLDKSEKASEYAQGYDIVLYIPTSGDYDDSLDYLENVCTISPEWATNDLIPELTIEFYSVNYRVINATCELAKIINTLSGGEALNEFRSQLEVQVLEEVKSLLGLITEQGEVAVGYNEELDRFREALEVFDTAVLDTETWLNDEIRRRLSESEAKLGGEQIIKILEAARTDSIEASNLRSYLPGDVSNIILDSVRKAEDRFCKILNLTAKEISWIDGVFPEEILLPLELNRSKINELENNLRKQFRVKEYTILREIADKLEKHMNVVRKAVQSVLEFDLFFAVGLFSKDYDLNAPEIKTESYGIGFENGLNIFLKEMEFKGEEKVVPINYIIGDPGFKMKDTNGEKIIILSGANSGGKTMAIQLIAQIAILAQMGFPVPAKKTSVSLFEELFYFGKSQGMVTAGALETTIKRFVSIVTDPASKLALFDEVEAMTESGAAAKIIAGILDMMCENQKTCAVFVSHLSDEILNLTKSPVRVDGISAKGLDENLNLIVDRTPKFNYLAKSTPELILQRLYSLSKGEEKVVFGNILKKLSETE
ncbi:MAG: MutS-related protein [Candidatus Jordarchaeum sp.]|uniref:MutS-related protein n=1 Tax=Candidatus Jordarchaeum sp. TaxID=2823881 RepID=UPI00404935A0